jgi:hypothetical protein
LLSEGFYLRELKTNEPFTFQGFQDIAKEAGTRVTGMKLEQTIKKEFVLTRLFFLSTGTGNEFPKHSCTMYTVQ